MSRASRARNLTRYAEERLRASIHRLDSAWEVVQARLEEEGQTLTFPALKSAVDLLDGSECSPTMEEAYEMWLQKHRPGVAVAVPLSMVSDEGAQYCCGRSEED